MAYPIDFPLSVRITFTPNTDVNQKYALLAYCLFSEKGAADLSYATGSSEVNCVEEGDDIIYIQSTKDYIDDATVEGFNSIAALFNKHGNGRLFADVVC